MGCFHLLCCKSALVIHVQVVHQKPWVLSCKVLSSQQGPSFPCYMGYPIPNIGCCICLCYVTNAMLNILRGSLFSRRDNKIQKVAPTNFTYVVADSYGCKQQASGNSIMLLSSKGFIWNPYYLSLRNCKVCTVWTIYFWMHICTHHHVFLYFPLRSIKTHKQTKIKDSFTL